MMAALMVLRNNWQVVVISLLFALVLILDARLDAAKAEHAQYRAEVEAVASGHRYMAEIIQQEQEKNLRTIEEKHDEKHVQEIRRRAVAAVSGRVQHAQPGSGAMPGIAAGQPADDVTREECAAAYAIVADAAEDADTLTIWQEWARLNKIPVVNDAGL